MPRAILFFVVATIVPLAAQNCAFNISPTSNPNVPVTGGSFGPVTINASAPSCARTVVSNASWISITYGATGSGNGTFGYAVDPNTGPGRTGTINAAGQTFTVTQAGCAFTFVPASASAPFGGGPGSFTVKTVCSWSAAGDSDWITIMSGSGGPGDGVVSYSVAVNPSGLARTGSITVGGQKFAITQAGAPCTFTLTPATTAVPVGGGSGSFNVAGPPGCAWTASPAGYSWITVTSGSSGTGSGTVGYTAAANTGAQRSGAIRVGSASFVITQAGVAPPPVTLTAIGNAASFTAGAVAPGEIVTLFGSNIGPAELATLTLEADLQTLTSTLAGAQVLFDGVPAPMVYASATQTSAIVPYAVDGRSATQVQVKYQGTPSNAMTLDVAPASPGIFSLDSSGAGQGAILNQDYSVNGAPNPAPQGSVIMIFATGEGQTTPLGIDGRLAFAPLPVPVLPVTVEIGGLGASVLYAGAAPGLVAGVLQVNVEIPASVPPGDAVPVVLQVGTAQSQPGVTVAVAARQNQ